MPEGSVPSPALFSYARLRPGTPEPADLRLLTEQLVAGIRHPDLNLRVPSHWNNEEFDRRVVLHATKNPAKSVT